MSTYHTLGSVSDTLHMSSDFILKLNKNETKQTNDKAANNVYI